MTTRKKVVFGYDPEPDLSWLDQDEFKNEDKDNHVALCMSVYEMKPEDEDWRIIDSLGNIDFLSDKHDWATGTFYNVEDLPEGYQQELARNAGLNESRGLSALEMKYRTANPNWQYDDYHNPFRRRNWFKTRSV